MVSLPRRVFRPSLFRFSSFFLFVLFRPSSRNPILLPWRRPPCSSLLPSFLPQRCSLVFARQQADSRTAPHTLSSVSTTRRAIFSPPPHSSPTAPPAAVLAFTRASLGRPVTQLTSMRGRRATTSLATAISQISYGVPPLHYLTQLQKQLLLLLLCCC